MIVNGGLPVNYQYDPISRITQVFQGNQAVGLTYDAGGRRTSLTYPNGTFTMYTYDPANRLTRIQHETSSTVIEDLTYIYDGTGNRIGVGRTGPQPDLPQQIQNVHDTANELIQFNSSTPNLSYDENGNLISETNVNGTTIYSWDARNRLIGIDGPSVSASFTYDPLGRRMSKTVNGIKIEYQYDLADVVSEIGDGTVITSYLRMPKADEPFIRQGIINEYYHADALGSTLALSNATGAATTAYSYETFGKTTISGASNNPFQYTGRENDGTGLYYYRARYYSPSMHRFISEDRRLDLDPGFCGSPGFTSTGRLVKTLISSEPADLNLFLYARGNPALFTDAGGLAARRRFSCPCIHNIPNCSAANARFAVSNTDLCLAKAPYRGDKGLPSQPPPSDSEEPFQILPCRGQFRTITCEYTCTDRKKGEYKYSYTFDCADAI